MSLAFFSGRSNSYCFLCAAVSIDFIWAFCSGDRDSWCFFCLESFILITWAFWSGERDLWCLHCTATLFFTNRWSLSSGERDSCFSLCASASVCKILTFFSGERDLCCFLWASVLLHEIWVFFLVIETVDSFVVQQDFWPKLVLFYLERGTLDIVSQLQSLFLNFVWRNIQHAF